MTKHSNDAPSIQERAMTIELSISSWTARKHDRKISQEVATTHGANGAAEDVGRYNKILISAEALKEIGRIRSRARAAHYHYTLPWHDDGPRLLSTRMYLDYMDRMTEFRDAFNAEADRFCSVYPQLIEDARSRLNGMFREEDYPKPSEIRRRFAFGIEIGMLPDAGDLRLDLSDDHLENVRAEIERNVSAKFEQATADIWTRVHDAVKHVHDRMRDYDPNARGKLHDSVIGNLRDLVAVLPALNINDDRALEEMRTKLERELCGAEVATLRHDPAARRAVQGKAASLVDLIASRS